MKYRIVVTIDVQELGADIGAGSVPVWRTLLDAEDVRLFSARTEMSQPIRDSLRRSVVDVATVDGRLIARVMSRKLDGDFRD